MKRHRSAERKPPRAWRKRLILAAVAVLAVGIGAAVLFRPRGGGPPPSGTTKSSPSEARDSPPAGSAQDAASPVVWTDVTKEAGIDFRHEAGARGEMFNPETFGSGGGWLDYDGDGKIDLLLVNSNVLRGEPDPRFTPILYRNLGGGRFEDATSAAGLRVPFYGMGFVSGDVDGDGDQDLLLYGLHRAYFLANDGGKFRDVTEAAGLSGLKGWICAATFLDYDRDAKLDLFVGNYVQWSPDKEKDVDCTFGTPTKKYCPVAVFDPSAPQLFRGRGDGTFEETTVAAGLSKLKGKTLGAAVEDYDRDGYPDIFVANDSVPNFLLHNRRDGTFEDRGVDSGLATDADGAALAGMGIDTAWAPDGGPMVAAIGNFSGEPATFHVQESVDYFVERSLSWGIGAKTLDRVTFGLLLYDEDLDGNLDLLLINGHVFDVEEITAIPYRQKPQLFLGSDWQTYREVQPEDPSHFLNRRIIGRSVAAADYDGDGDLDLAVTENQGRAVLLRNDLPSPRNYLRLELRGTRSHRDALGAEVTIHLVRPSGTHSVRRTRKATSSYLSQSERQLVFGLGREGGRHEVEVLWPSGLREYFLDVPASKEVLLVEGSGIAAPQLASGAGSPGVTSRPGETRAPGTSENSVVARRRALDLFRMGRFSEALDGFGLAVRLDPQDFVAHRFALICLFRLGRKADVRSKADEIARLFPDPHFLISHFALVLRESSLEDLAEIFFRKAIDLDPRRTDAWIAIGNIAFDRRNTVEALRCYEAVLKFKPGSLEALANTGKVHTILKDYDKAIPYLEKALSIRPGYATALSTLGGVMIEKGQFDLAEQYLQGALESPSSKETQTTIHGNLGILHYKRREWDRARQRFQKVLELDPGDSQAKAVLERLESRREATGDR